MSDDADDSGFDNRGGEASTTTYEYDENGRLARVIDAADDDETNFEYDALGRKIRETDAGGNETRWIYDEYGQLTDVIQKGYINESAGSITDLSHVNYGYDNVGRQVQVNNRLFIPTGVSTNRTITLAAGSLDDKPSTGTWVSTRTEYDRLGRATFQVDDEEHVTETKYDGMGRVLSVEDAQGNLIENWYDDNGNVIETKRTDAATVGGTDPEVFRTTFFYDSLDRLVLQIDNASQATDYRYNTRDLVVAVADANGPCEAARSFNRRGDTATTVTVNNLGNVTLTDYDEVGRQTQVTQILTSTGLGDGTNIGRTTSGASATAPTADTGQEGGDGKIITKYVYDVNGMLKELIDDEGNKSAWAFDAQNRKVAETKGIMVSPSLADRDDADTTIEWIF